MCEHLVLCIIVVFFFCLKARVGVDGRQPLLAKTFLPPP